MSMVRQIPNIITSIRIALTLLFAVLYLQGFTDVATVILIVALVSDLADGYIARKFNLKTRLGEILDPVSDKLSHIIICLCLYTKRLVPLWFILLLVIKEVSMMVLGSVCLKKKVKILGAKWYGKASTLLLNVVISFNLVFVDFVSRHPVMQLCMYTASAVLLYAAFVGYVIAHLKLMRKDSIKTSDAEEVV